jgi:hypothetical protein
MLGPRNGSGSGCTSLPLSVNSFSTINNAGAPSAGTSSTTDLDRSCELYLSLGFKEIPNDEQPADLRSE